MLTSRLNGTSCCAKGTANGFQTTLQGKAGCPITVMDDWEQFHTNANLLKPTKHLSIYDTTHIFKFLLRTILQLGICDTVHIEYHVSLQLNCSIQYCITIPNTNSMKLIMTIDYIYPQALHALITV